MCTSSRVLDQFDAICRAGKYAKIADCPHPREQYNRWIKRPDGASATSVFNNAFRNIDGDP